LTAHPLLILASSSIYRRELLARLRIEFEVDAPEIDESSSPGETPADIALRLACAKAHAVAARHPSAFIIGSDQVAVLDGRPLGKPCTHNNAVAQLAAMRGKSVVFHTALCVLNSASGSEQSANVPTTVHFRNYTDAQIERYLKLEQPYDCAGSAKIEGLGIALVECMESSDPTALIGLPLMLLTTMLANAGIHVIAP